MDKAGFDSKILSFFSNYLIGRKKEEKTMKLNKLHTVVFEE